MSRPRIVNAREDAVLLYDGLCGFCDGAVQFILARDRTRTLKFAALQGRYATALIERHPELRAIDSLILVQSDALTHEDHVLVRSDAVVAIAKYLGGVWRVLSGMLRLVPRPLRDWGYNRMARIRYTIFGRRDQCRIPTPEQRAQFLE
ncbi:MAG: DCC1-like thiol-disulfide oxidoreductase family protein [Gemmatimonadaceae bacterium]